MRQAKIKGFFPNQRGDTMLRLSNGKIQTLYEYMWEQNYGKKPKGTLLHHKKRKRKICSLKDLMLVTPIQHKYFHRGKGKKRMSKNRSKKE